LGFRVCADSKLPFAVVEIEIAKAADTEADGVWMDPSGTHHILTTKHRKGTDTLHETHYFHSRRGVSSLPRPC